MIPTRIVRRHNRKLKSVGVDGRPVYTNQFLCNDERLYTYQALAGKVGMEHAALKSRISRHGLNSPLILLSKDDYISRVKNEDNFTIIKRKGTMYLCSDGECRTLTSLAMYFGISTDTLHTRIKRYGASSPLVVYPGKITFDMIERKKPTVYDDDDLPLTPKWNRKLCRRDGINCANYSDCQAQRCGLAGYPEWQHRESTDECYAEPAPEMVMRGMDTTRFASWGF